MHKTANIEEQIFVYLNIGSQRYSDRRRAPTANRRTKRSAKLYLNVFFSGSSPKLKLTEIDLITINLVSTKWYRNKFGRQTLTLFKKKLKWKFSKCWSTVDAEKCTKQHF
jgi:hypothetical protein